MRFYDERLETSVGRMAGGLVVGSATGTVVTLIGFLGMALVTAEDPLATLARAPGGLLLAIPVFIVWMIGAFTIAIAGWSILHALRLRGALTAAAWGGAVTFLVATGMTSGQAMPFATLIGVAGVLAGLATWRVSYRRVGEVFA